MIKQSNIPEAALPSELEKANTIRIGYRTNLLIPSPGPLAAAGLVLSVASQVAELLDTFYTFDAIADYHARYGKLTLIVPVTSLPPSTAADRDPYLTRLVYPIQEQIRLLAEQIRISDESLGLLRRAPAGPSSPLALVRRSVDTELRALISGQLAVAADLEARRNKHAVLERLAKPSRVKRELFRAGVVKESGEVVEESLLQMQQRERAKMLIKTLAQRVTPAAGAPIVNAAHIQLALRVVTPKTDYQWLADQFQSDTELQQNLTGYLVNSIHPWLPGLVPPDDPMREWGMQRHEELRLALGTPFFRGPVSANSVAPKSDLTLTATATREAEEAVVVGETEIARRAISETAISTSRFERRLDNLSEYGITDDNAFSSTSILFSALSEERRTAIQQVVDEISTQNERRTLTRALLSATYTSEYTTEGKDPKLATTELGFQVVVPAKASVWLKDVGLIWSPSIINPFIKLREMIQAYRVEVEANYRNQYYVPSPVMPPQHPTEVRPEPLHISGAFEHPVPSPAVLEFSELIPLHHDPQYGEAFVDIKRITVTAEAKEFYFDTDEYEVMDKPHKPIPSTLHDVTFSVQEKRLSGRLVINPFAETTSTTLYIEVYATITVPILTYDAGTAAAIRQYNTSLTEIELQERSIEARAEQFGLLKQQELIRKYENSIHLRQEVFRQLLQWVLFGNLDLPGWPGALKEIISKQKLLYYEQVISSCINWPESRMTFASAELDALYYRDLPPDHFLNAIAVRMFLPIKKTSEDTFFKTLEAEGPTPFTEKAAKIRAYLNAYREELDQLQASNSDKLRLDQFDTEIIIGQHLEAVLSHFEFSMQT